MHRLVRPTLLSALVLVSCFQGPPRVVPSDTLGPGSGIASPRAKARFAIAFAGPRGVVSEREDPAITALFNRPMRTLDTPDGAGLPPLRIETTDGQPVAGSPRWLGTHGVLFLPDAPLPGATGFIATIASGVRSLDGDTLGLPYRFEFSTSPPALLQSEPSDGATDVRARDAFRLVFNQTVDPGAIEKSAALIVSGRAEPFHATRPANPPTGTPRERAVLVTPDAPLPLDSVIALTLRAGLHGAEGPMPMQEARTVSVRTYGPLALADVRCAKVNLGRCQAHRDVTVVLSNAVTPEELNAHLRTTMPRVVPAAAPRPGIVKKRAEPSRAHPLAVDPQTGKRYRVTLTAGMQDVYGQRLAKDVAFDVAIEASFEKPARAAASSGNVGPPPPSADDPRPRRPVVDYEATFGVRGNLLEASTAPGAKRRDLPISVVNVPTYGLAAAALQEQDALRWLAKTDPSGGLTGGGWRWDWISPGVPENVRSVRTLDLDALLASTKGARVALVALAIPGSEQPRSTAMLDVTDLGVTAKLSRFGSLVWVTRLSTGAPVSGAIVALRNAKRELFSAATDAGGVVRVPQETFKPVADNGSIDSSAWLFVRAGDDWVYQRVERSMADVRAARDVDLAHRKEWEALVFTDRGVYRPGETLKLSAIVRQSDVAGLKLPASTDVRVEVKDAQDDRIFSGHASTDAFGELALDVPLPRTSHLGQAVVSVQLGRGDADVFATNVTLAAYKASEFRVEVEAAQHEYVRGDAAGFSVKAEYLYGAPMAGAPAHNAASRSRTAFAPKGSDGFETTDDVFTRDHPDESPRSEDLRVGDGELDVQGRLRESIPLDLPGQRGPELVTFETQIEDLTRQTVAERASVLVHPAPFYVGLRRSELRFLAVGAPFKAEVAAFEPGGARRAGVPVHVELVSRNWTDVVVDEASDVPRHVTQAVDTVVGSCDAATTTAGSSCTVRVPSAGYFIARASSTGPVVHASIGFDGIDDRPDAAAVVGWKDNGARGLTIESDKETYAAGDTAKVLIRSPFKEADALVTVERAGVLWQNVVHVRGPMPLVSVPMKSEYYPNVFVGVHLVRGRVAPPPAVGQADVGAPDFRTAFKEVTIDPETHRLKVDVSPSRAEYQPGEEVDADVQVTSQGQGTRAAVTFYAVDEGVLMLTGYKTPDPLPAFAEHKHLADFGLDNREHLAHLVALKNGERVPIRSYEYQGNAASEFGYNYKGDEGGGGDGAALRADFRTTAYFEPSRATSDEGKAHFRFKLPDNLTRFRLMAVVASADDRFGFGESAITANRKLMARPAIPRVVRVGDAFEASVVVSSKDAGTTNVDVTLDANGVLLGGPRVHNVPLQRNGQVEVRFPVRAIKPGQAELVFTVAAAGRVGDRVLVQRMVDLPVDVRASAVYGEMTTNAAIALGDLKRVRPDQGSLELRMATSALVGIDSAFDQLSEYPYGCTEQLTARTIPLLALDDMAHAYHVRVPAGSHDAIDEAVGKILKNQHGSGGFGFWEDEPEVPWLSAYAMWALEAASKKGFYVPVSSLDHGVEYLRAQLAKEVSDKSAGDEDGAPSSKGDEPTRDDYPAKVFIADVLAMIGASDPGYLNRAYEARARQPLSSQALLLHAMATAHMQTAELQRLSREIEQRLRVGPGEAVADEGGDENILDSPARTTAFALRALLAADPRHPLAPRLARGLLGLRRNGAWRSTQENLWALIALEDYRRTQESMPANVDVRAYLGDDAMGTWSFRSGQIVGDPLQIPMTRVARRSGEPITFAMKGSGKAFFSAELRYAVTDLPTRPEDNGFFVQRLVRALKPSDLKAAEASLPHATMERAMAGDLVLVDLLVESAEPRDQVVIDDPLPAGLEPVDFDLETSPQIARAGEVGTERLSRHRALLAYGWSFAVPDQVHRELHDDRVLTFARHLDPGMYHFRYLARATTLGRFVAPPAEIRCMYAPEVSGRTAATTFDVVAPAARVAAR
jgi:alpha-2-macroglobulin